MKYNSYDFNEKRSQYGVNKPHKTEDGLTLYDGRYCAVSGFIFAIVNGKYSVLANKRGPGTPDYQGYWNCPCGYLEKYESSIEGIAREIYEECSFAIDLNKIKIVGVETNPEVCNHGNVTIRHTAFLGKQTQYFNNWDWLADTSRGGEKNEVAAVRWVPIDSIDEHRWAFNHKSMILKYAPSKFIRKLIELIYKFKL